MVASVSTAAAAYANAGKITAGGGGSATGSGFGDLLQQAAGDAMGALKTGGRRACRR